jgi:hypothetical protein
MAVMDALKIRPNAAANCSRDLSPITLFQSVKEPLTQINVRKHRFDIRDWTTQCGDLIDRLSKR